MTVRKLASPGAIAAVVLAGVFIAGWTSLAAADDKDNMQRRPTVCTEQYLPVCGKINNVTKTYSNVCFARAAGAKVIAQGPCR
jgi:Kazal-type serine protease inhibitor domain